MYTIIYSFITLGIIHTRYTYNTHVAAFSSYRSYARTFTMCTGTRVPQIRVHTHRVCVRFFFVRVTT